MSGSAPGRSAAAGALLGAFALAFLVWMTVLWSSVRQDPGPGGWLAGLFGGGFAALVVAGIGAWAAMFLVARPARRAAEQELAVCADDDELGRILGELEVTRLHTERAINASAAWRIPLCVAGATVLWGASQLTDEPADGFDLLVFLGMAAIGGYVWASLALGEAYRRTFKERVLPKLAASFGPLAWRPAQPPVDELRGHGIFTSFDDYEAEDEIHGEYRGLPLSIVELKLTRSEGKKTVTVFHGLTAAVTLPRGLAGTTIVVPDRGFFGNRTRLRDRYQPVRLEDPVFEKAYEVYGSDQISARALLTPAFMERFMALATSGRFGAPVALIQDNRLLMALDTPGGRNLFEPPSYRRPAASRDALTQMHDDIAAVLKAADAVIDLDQAARLQPRA